MGDLLDLIIKFGSTGSDDLGRSFIRCCRFIMLLVFSTLLYKRWVGDFSIVTTADMLLDYFLSARFLYSVLIFLLITGCETITTLLIAKLNALLIVSKAIKAMEEIKKEQSSMTPEAKNKARNDIDDFFKKHVAKIFIWIGDVYQYKRIKKEVLTKLKKVRPELLENYSVFAIELYLYLICTGHSWAWIFALLPVLGWIACFKAVLILLKTIVPFLQEPKKAVAKIPVAPVIN